ncbi:MAG: FAD-dependent oxidoreductase [Bacilli bacterium]|nr:FAD-dependent oxidoreductase [Bacilli bacterium]
MDFDTIVIGGGPAGMTAALYLLRAGKSVLLLEHEAIGGQISESPRLENFPSIKRISGSSFADALFDQITDLGVKFEFESAQSIEKIEGGFRVNTDYNPHTAKTIVIATGCKHRHLGIEREEELTGHGISYCAVCDGAFYKGKDVVLIGDANTAIQYAIQLSDGCSHVYVCTLFDKFFADNILVENMKKIENISYRHNLSTISFVGGEELTGVIFEDTKTKERIQYDCAAAFIAIGQVPDNEKFASWVDMDRGFIKTDESMKTKTDGIYAVGDCRVKNMRQVITATSDGAIAAIAIANYLNSL